MRLLTVFTFAVLAVTGFALSDATAQQIDPAKAEAVAADPLLPDADLARGLVVFSRVGICTNCHGWDGNGKGKNPRADGITPPLRQTELDTAGLIEVISCGRPGTGMPYHDNQAYKDDRCYGMTMADFTSDGTGPHKGKSVNPQDIINLVGYLEAAIVGKPDATYEDCAAYFGDKAEKNCAAMK